MSGVMAPAEEKAEAVEDTLSEICSFGSFVADKSRLATEDEKMDETMKMLW